MTYRAGHRDVYVLHITTKDGQVMHYIGSTKKDRFAVRCKEHKRGKGSAETAMLAKLGATFEGQIIAYNASPLEEFLLAIEKDRHCPICNAKS